MLEGHQHSVWAIDSFKDLPDSVLTGSADRTVSFSSCHAVDYTINLGKTMAR